MVKEGVEKALVSVQQSINCLEERHDVGPILRNLRSSDFDRINKAELLHLTQEFILEYDMIHDVWADLVNEEQCLHHKLQRHLKQIVCLLKTTMEDNPIECTISKQFIQPRHFSGAIDRTGLFIRHIYTTLSGYLVAH
ncbi:uncharacterized protein LOC132727135 isoform X2 [Ruditapes philippinarum]|nr:uncharacterized protein LOC132727135 isoform X2 [Ruditapes philippinarum]